MAEYEVELHAEWSRQATMEGEVRAFRPAVRKALTKHVGARDISIEVTKVPEGTTDSYRPGYGYVPVSFGTYKGTISFTTDVTARSQREAVELAEAKFRTAIQTKHGGRRRRVNGVRESYSQMERRLRNEPGMTWCRGPKVTIV
jgi:hypothetical protein